MNEDDPESAVLWEEIPGYDDLFGNIHLDPVDENPRSKIYKWLKARMEWDGWSDL